MVGKICRFWKPFVCCLFRQMPLLNTLLPTSWHLDTLQTLLIQIFGCWRHPVFFYFKLQTRSSLWYQTIHGSGCKPHNQQLTRSMLRAASSSVLFDLSATPFWAGVYVVLVSWRMPFSAKNLLKSFPMYSSPLSERSVRTVFPVSLRREKLAGVFVDQYPPHRIINIDETSGDGTWNSCCYPWY